MENLTRKVPAWFWVLAVFFLLWNIMGVWFFYYHTFMPEADFNAMTEAEQNLMGEYPLWTKIAFAMATFGGLAGAIGLIMRKKWAKTAFIISIIGIIPQMVHSLFFTNSREVYGPGTEVMPAMVVVFGIFLVWFSIFSLKKGWLR